jgi:electron transfer flavoprotein alpha subunit
VTRATGGPLRVASLAKQVPVAESFRLEEGRLVRRGVDVEMNAYCRRAVAEGVTLARATQGTCTAVTLGPPGAEDVLREAIAWGATSGLHVCDPAFAGSDTLATARALAAVLRAAGPFDLVLLGRNSIDGETGQVGPEVAALLDLPFASGVRAVEDGGACLRLVLEHDDGMQEVEITLPAVLSVAERLCEPCKVEPHGRAAVPASLITRVTARELGDGPWGQAGSPTVVGETRPMEHDRSMLVLEGAVEEQVRAAVRELTRRGALDAGPAPVTVTVTVTVPVPVPVPGPVDEPVDEPARPGQARAPEPASRPIAVLVEPGRPEVTGELLGAAARLGRATGAAVHALSTGDGTTEALGAAGADLVVVLDGSRVPEDVADAVADYVRDLAPWALLAPSTAFGREVAGRAAALTGSGLVGDAIALSARGGVLVAAKPAFAGALVADITCTSATQMATIRPGVLPVAVHEHRAARVETRPTGTRGRVRVLSERRDDDVETLARAEVVIGVGTGVAPQEYEQLSPLAALLGAELGATRKVTDRGWAPRSRQVGITGRSIAPRLYVALGLSGKFNHVVGVRAAGTILAVNRDPGAPVFAHCDIGIVGDWHEVVLLLQDALRNRAAEPDATAVG